MGVVGHSVAHGHRMCRCASPDAMNPIRAYGYDLDDIRPELDPRFGISVARGAEDREAIDEVRRCSCLGLGCDGEAAFTCRRCCSQGTEMKHVSTYAVRALR
jgi:hypothetical protein